MKENDIPTLKGQVFGTPKYIKLNKRQKNTLLQYVLISFGLSFIMSIVKDSLEAIELIPTLGIGTITTDLFFTGIAELISRSLESNLSIKDIPYARVERRGRIISILLNLLPFFSYIRFGYSNLIPAVTGRIKIV